jgi:hypothetical protein
MLGIRCARVVEAAFLDRFVPGLGNDIAVNVYVCPYARTSRRELAAVSLLALRSRSSRSSSGTMHAGQNQRESTEEGRGIHVVCLAAVNIICENVRFIYYVEIGSTCTLAGSYSCARWTTRADPLRHCHHSAEPLGRLTSRLQEGNTGG